LYPQPPLRTRHLAGTPRNPLIYDRWGRYGRPVLLLHGLLFDRTMWWPLAAELSATASCTVVAPDLPGHGESPRRDGCVPERIAGELASLVLSLGLHRAPVVVGHGTSARLACVFADAFATRHVLTLDEPPAGLTGVDDVIAASGLGDVPDHYRPFAEPRRDTELLRAYPGWLSQPTARRTELATAGGTAVRPPSAGSFPHLTEPEVIAAELRDLL
jgi:pimeloyl-ACP methyl ester carboxylesterase